MAKKIYIIDDDKDIVDVLTTILNSKGYETFASYSAKEAIEKSREIKPDLIVLDIMFPENSSEGFDVARSLHNEDDLKEIPIVVLSAVNEAYSLGFSNRDIDDSWMPVKQFIEKPIDPDQFLTIVGNIIGS